MTEVADFARDAEAAGFETIWIPDSQFLWHDAWTTATLVADRTNRIGIGVAVTNFETRHVAITANVISSVDELSGGRVQVAFGSGDSAVKTIGRRPTLLRDMRESIAILRRLLRGEDVVWEGSDKYGGRPMRLRHPAGRDVPIFMAATGPKALALAGEVADGVIVAAGVAPHLIVRALNYVREGAERGGRSLAELNVFLAAHTIVAPDEGSAVREVKPLCLAMAQLGAKEALRAVGIEIDVPAVVAGIYPDVTHAESWDLAVRTAEDYIDDAAAERYAAGLTLAGTAEQVAKRIEAAIGTGMGINGFFLIGPSSYELPRNQLDAFGSTLIPRFGR
ncbi:LLM class flavin-dependent oxidoreductase [Streptomyces sp. NBC_01643]|uniref:LLM class flavin-dependent oxidoreductase n=1 Tax=Streptomyces sp. NBC_01643 TaxID=2975906 RepID=UPI002F908D71|nr:LLM class flavin-dependent oxidoreductase [Streptomyces sp. NBC_01643]